MGLEYGEERLRPHDQQQRSGIIILGLVRFPWKAITSVVAGIRCGRWEADMVAHNGVSGDLNAGPPIIPRQRAMAGQWQRAVTTGEK